MVKNMTLKPGSLLSVREHTYRVLKEKILTGYFSPNRRLAEESLAKLLGVSRTPIREALHKLELEGLVTLKGARGFCVPEETSEDILELFEIRSVLEGHALACLCMNISDDNISLLNDYIKKAETGTDRGNLELVFDCNTQFHDFLYGLIRPKKPRLYNLIEDMREYVLRYRKNTLDTLEAARRSIAGHKKIVMALESRDPVLCEHVMRAHVREAREDTSYVPAEGGEREVV